MSAGIRVYNDHGGLIIDGEYANFTLSNRGVSQILNSGKAYIRVKGKYPLLSWASNFPLVHRITHFSGDDVEFVLESERAYAGRVFDFFVFDLPVLQDQGSVGLKVWSPDGNLVFDSNQKWMRVVGVANLPLDLVLATPRQIGFPTPTEKEDTTPSVPVFNRSSSNNWPSGKVYAVMPSSASVVASSYVTNGGNPYKGNPPTIYYIQYGLGLYTVPDGIAWDNVNLLKERWRKLDAEYTDVAAVRSGITTIIDVTNY